VYEEDQLWSLWVNNVTIPWNDGQTIAHRLRVRGSGLDPTSTRLRITNLLQAVDMHPDGLAPSAILCVRTFRDPLPGRLQLRDGGYALQPPAEWRRAVASSLNHLVREAARPAREAVPTNAEAVLFADSAEVLACLASDWCECVVGTRWWWQSLFSSLDLVQGIVSIWQGKPAYVPAALQYLAERGKAIHFVRRLEAGDARMLVQALTETFALPTLRSALHSSYLEETWVEDKHIQTSFPPGRAAEVHITPLSEESTASATHPAPWQSWVPEAAQAGLQREQQCLLGIGLMLKRAPMHVRTTAFVDAVQQWQRQSLLPLPLFPPSSAAQTAPVLLHSTGTANPSALDRKGGVPEGTEAVNGTHKTLEGTRTDARSVAPGSLEAVEANTQEASTLTAAAPSKDPVNAELPILACEHATIEQGGELAPPAEVEPIVAAADKTSLNEEYVETSYGGIFYLLNLAIALDLYSDFTRPLTPGIPLNIWDFVALLGLSLLGEPLRHDPAWWLLAHLAVRDAQEPPGKDFAPPEAWRVPREWLVAFPEQAGWLWWVERERLCVYHPAGFIVLDLPLAQHDPQEQLEQEMREYVEYALPVASKEKPITQSLADYPVSTVPPHLERWLNWLIPYVWARLSRALRLASVDDLPGLLCRHVASVRVTATHLDIFLSLQELPIAIRLSGLDRDPGWIPAAGRFVAFHFR